MLEYTIYCDSCGEMIDIQSGSARQARKRAKKKGLLIRVQRKDYCPKCGPKLESEGEIDILTPKAKGRRVGNFRPFKL